MSMISENYRELRNLIDLLCQSEITSNQLERLQVLAASSEGSRAFFLQYRQMHAALQWRFRDEPLREDAALLAGFLQQEKPASTAIAVPLRSRLTNLLSYQVTGLSLLGIVIAGLFWGFWGYLIHTDRERWGHPSLTAERLETAARLQSDADCQWDSAQPAPRSGDELSVGTTLHLRAGRCELAFHRGSRVVLQGPAEIRLQSSNSAHLQIGKLTANVPPEAIGFTVATPTAQVIDLGTEFGVAVEANGTTDVHVLQGRVELNQLTDLKESRAPKSLQAGEAMRVVAGAPHAVRIPFGDASKFSSARGARSLKSIDRLKTAINTIWLGNLFDDRHTTPLAKAMETDTIYATPEIDDLGVERVLYGGDALKRISPQLWFDAKNLGWEDLALGKTSNDAWGTLDGQATTAISTRGLLLKQTELKLEEGIGASLDVLLTFDLDEIRAAGGSQQSRQFEFVCDRAGINDNGFGDTRASARMVVLVSDSNRVQTAVVNGMTAKVAETAGVWSIVSPIPEPLRADGGFAEFRAAIPADAKYLTLLTTSAGDGGIADFAVWSNARLEVQK